ncbi:flagellar motor switch protein FliG [Reinekea marina]|uniref:Flagellar motor switch protein FliG n=1 Tax=Reinekea marina TaxID=1310421 RepID=A0ABV7WMV7_9GAMM|nr:flagellar motor switch protein FliG [Reinekea marina]MBU2863157.1 flagellar motor switch protein FliG [Reinekea forsetii]MDN3649361.1 flagellar motor switch protein FliG [Reinekea marina]
MTENRNLPATQDGEDLSKILDGVTMQTRAAMLLMSVGEQDAAEVLKHMGPKEVQRVGTAMSTMPEVKQDQIEGVVRLFLEEVGGQTSLGMGANDYIKNMLTQALGEDKAAGLIDRILLGGNTTGLDTLKWMEPRAVADIIRNEHPQIQTIVIAYLEPDQSSEILAQFPEKVRLDIIMRVAALESVQPSALQELNAILEKQFSASAGTQAQSLGGVKTAAEIMNFLESGVEAEIMDGIKEVDEDLATEISDLMFVFDNLIDVDDRGIQGLLREVSTDSLKIALRGADSSLAEKILGNMSKRAAEILRDDMEAMGPVKVSEVEVAQKEILGIARRMSDAGEIALGGAGGEDML